MLKEQNRVDPEVDETPGGELEIVCRNPCLHLDKLKILFLREAAPKLVYSTPLNQKVGPKAMWTMPIVGVP